MSRMPTSRRYTCMGPTPGQCNTYRRTHGSNSKWEPRSVGYSRIRTERQRPLSKRLRTLGKVATRACRNDVGLNVASALTQRVNVVKVGGMGAAVGACIAPTLEDGRTRVGHMVNAIGFRPALVGDLMALVRTQPGIVAPDVLALLVAPTASARRGRLLGFARQEIGNGLSPSA